MSKEAIKVLQRVFFCSCGKGARRKHLSDCAHYWIDDLIGELDVRGFLISPPLPRLGTVGDHVSLKVDSTKRGVIVDSSPWRATVNWGDGVFDQYWWDQLVGPWEIDPGPMGTPPWHQSMEGNE